MTWKKEQKISQWVFDKEKSKQRQAILKAKRKEKDATEKEAEAKRRKYIDPDDDKNPLDVLTTPLAGFSH